MPKFDSKAESQTFEHITGDYPFEVVAVDNEISQGAKTRGSDTREVKLKFFKDATFAAGVAQWTETFIYHDSTEWKCSVFAKCVGKVLTDGEDFDIDASWIGLRGWASCRPEVPSNEKSKPLAEQKKYNRVQAFLTNKGQLPRNANAAPAKPAEDDDIPF